MLSKIAKTSIKYILLLLTIAGCRTYDNVYSNYDESIDFTEYKTYAWLNTKKSDTTNIYTNDIIENNTKSYVDREFLARGYTVNLDTPDLFFELVLINEKKQETVPSSYDCDNFLYNDNSYNPIYNLNPYFSNPYYNNFNYYYQQRYNQPFDLSACDYSLCNNQTIEYVEGTITINVIDRKLNRLVWTGSAEGDIYDPQYLKDEINPAIKRILAQYPVKALAKDNNT